MFTAVFVCRALAEHPDVSTPEVWERLAACHRSLHNMDAALTVSACNGLGGPSAAWRPDGG